METDGLAICERDFEPASRLIEAIRKLPDGTIGGLSEYCTSNVFLKMEGF